MTNLLKFEKEIQDKYSLIALQFDNSQILAKCRENVPVLGHHKNPGLGLVRELTYWFKNDFMKWNKTRKLKRFNFIPTLLFTKEGRCGEWAIVFTAMLCSLGYRARVVLDFSDHVWTEVWINRWIHIDCTLSLIDEPSYYQKVWHKKKTKVLSFSPHHVSDVTHRYYK